MWLVAPYSPQKPHHHCKLTNLKEGRAHQNNEYSKQKCYLRGSYLAYFSCLLHLTLYKTQVQVPTGAAFHAGRCTKRQGTCATELELLAASSPPTPVPPCTSVHLNFQDTNFMKINVHPLNVSRNLFVEKSHLISILKDYFSLPEVHGV